MHNTHTLSSEAPSSEASFAIVLAKATRTPHLLEQHLSWSVALQQASTLYDSSKKLFACQLAASGIAVFIVPQEDAQAWSTHPIGVPKHLAARSYQLGAY